MGKRRKSAEVPARSTAARVQGPPKARGKSGRKKDGGDPGERSATAPLPTPQSMTGFGRAEDREDATRIVCEMRSVNHRFLTTKFRLPPYLLRFEHALDERLKERLGRGSVEVFVQVQSRGVDAAALFDAEVADRYLRDLGRFAKRHGLTAPLGVSDVLGLPGVVVPADPADQASRLEPRLRTAFEGALDALLAMRAREGRRLTEVLLRELDQVGELAVRIRALVPAVVAEQHARLADRLARLLPPGTVSADDPTLGRELALLADRSDVTEELDRIESHVREFRRSLASNGPVGRSLEFVVQEFGREFNTIGAKSQDPRVVSAVLAGKTAVERLREQVQNVE